MRIISSQTNITKAYDGPSNGMLKANFIDGDFTEMFYEPENPTSTDTNFYFKDINLLKEVYQAIGDFFLDQRIEANYTSDDKLPKKPIEADEVSTGKLPK